ncbi:P-loop containing nucleoside triphosphate hydrolase protein [Aspergillus keveii]|uniref:P-loop containing nucleoside triphosphate hydrolase protein n=1 Tax=Aspergillus keveii TaxID=714993 RepID=A0ABR4FNU6_9EURO
MLHFILRVIQAVIHHLQRTFVIIGTSVYTSICRLQARLNQKYSKILIAGPRNAGRTTLAHKLRTESGGKVDWREIAAAKRKRLTFIETSGFAAPPLASFLPGTAGIIFMIDAKDYNLLPETRRILDDLLKSEEVAGVPVVIFVNKIDHYGAVGPEEFLMLMGLDNGDTGLDLLRNERAIEVVFGSVVLGQGVDEAIRWLVEHV